MTCEDWPTHVMGRESFKFHLAGWGRLDLSNTESTTLTARTLISSLRQTHDSRHTAGFYHRRRDTRRLVLNRGCTVGRQASAQCVAARGRGRLQESQNAPPARRRPPPIESLEWRLGQAPVHRHGLLRPQPTRGDAPAHPEPLGPGLPIHRPPTESRERLRTRGPQRCCLPNRCPERPLVRCRSLAVWRRQPRRPAAV